MELGFSPSMGLGSFWLGRPLKRLDAEGPYGLGQPLYGVLSGGDLRCSRGGDLKQPMIIEFAP